MRRAAATAFVYTIFVFMAAILGSVLTARMLGPQGRGEYAIVTTWAAVLATFASLSIGDAMGVRAARSSGAPAEVLAIARQSIGPAICVAFAMILPLLAVFHFGVAFSGFRPGPIPYALVALTVIATPVNLFVGSYHRALERHVLHNLARGLAPLLFPVGVGLVALAKGNSASLQDIVLVLLAATGISLLFSLATATELFTRGFRERYDAGLVREAVAMHATTLTFSLSANVDRFLAMYLLPVAEFGFYGVAASVAQPPSSLLWITVSKIMIGDRGLQDEAKRPQRLQRYIRLLLIAILVLSGMAALLLYWLVPVTFGAEFTPAAAMSAWLVFGYALSPMRLMISEVNRITRNFSFSVLIEFLYMLTFIILSTFPLFIIENKIQISLLFSNIFALLVVATIIRNKII